MKRKISFAAVFIGLSFLLGLTSITCFPAAAEEGAVVSFRVEGADKTLYFNNALVISGAAAATMRDVVRSCGALTDVPAIAVSDDSINARITSVGTLREKSLGSPFEDGWMIRVNGQNAEQGLDRIPVKNGDDVVIYYCDKSLIQYPEIYLTRMITDGIVKFTSTDETRDEAGVSYSGVNPVVGASVVWDGMRYTTDTNGEIIIDSTGAGVRHSVAIERYYAGGLPTVLRFAPGCFVSYGYHDVSKDDWFYDAVMFVTDAHVLNGVTETDFAPDSLVNKAMFITVLGRMADADVDQSADTGFTDVVSDGWSPGYIQWALQSGITGGNSDGTFGQYEVMTREQIAVMLYRYAVMRGYNTTEANTDLSAYDDGSIVSQYAVTAVIWAAANGIITGSSGRLDPGGPATRAQVAAMLGRFIMNFIP